MRETPVSHFGLKAARRDAKRRAARATLAACGVPLGADFHTLPSATVEELIRCANTDRYRKPTNANGSRGRYYHAKLQREARDA